MAYKTRKILTRVRSFDIKNISKKEKQLIPLWNTTYRSRNKKATLKLFKNRAKASGYSDKEIDYFLIGVGYSD